MSEPDTIVALSTPAGESAVALIRLSGPACVGLGMLTTGRTEALPARFAHYASYLDQGGEALDDCIFTFFAAERSYTGQAMLEIASHGNPLIVQKILEDLLSRGCRPAEAGEFTRTAFLNGKLDLSQAEAVADLIHARSARGLEVARRQLHGSVGRKISALTERLLSIQARLEAYIDFPEEDLPTEDEEGPAADLLALSGEVCELIETRRYSALLHEGVRALIVGMPNAGKSSLINALTGMDRSIVSSQPGTTRDYVSDRVEIGGWCLEILDTAGLRDGGDAIEQMGMARTLELADSADLFLLVLDLAAPSPTLPAELLGQMRPDNTLVLENKTDLAEASAVAPLLPDCPRVRTCLLDGTGLGAVRDGILSMINAGLSLPGKDGIVVNARHADALKKVDRSLQTARELLKEGEFTELVATELREAVHSLGEVVGKIDNERMLDSLFEQFCIGK
ncbi:MAG: tRNA uridine-5-carboxymethylaminomethyl(34) synthesis GTPase MnmE [Coraliomargaritaceae bacterium]